ncbi:unnamed protein product [Cuscuta campestris]|uniref:Transposase (putative) gypsy type domain-containing protein n=1 Tax=Cuscuta campestris TaxID=132261 RepID=A0A484N1G9_9ASTE|nr:unnamed protein product [Cuscuta campestris]
MKKTISKVSKIFNGGKKSKEDENASSITPAQLGEMRGVIPPDYGVQEATGTTLERNPDISRRLVVHYDSVRMGCRFPLHPLLVELCNRYAIPPGQISSNSDESLFGFLVRCHKRGIQPTLKLFLSFFRPHKYDGELGRGFVSFTARTNMQFLDSPVDKLDDWFRRFFVVVVPEDLPFPNMWRKKEDKFPSHLFPPRDSELEGVFRLLRKNGYPVPRALLLKDSYFRGLGFWVSPDIPPQEPSGDTTSSWVPPFRNTQLRRRSSRRDPSPEEDTEGEEVESATGALSLALAHVAGIGIPCSTESPWEYSPSSSCGGDEAISQPQTSNILNFANSAAENIFGTPFGHGDVPLPGTNIHQSFLETEELIRSSSFGKATVPSSIRPTAIPGPSIQETGSSSSSQVRHKRGRNSTPLPGSLVSACPPMGTADDGFLIGQGGQPFPYAREAYQFTGYTSWVGRDFNNKLQEIQQLKRNHPDVVHSPAWPFMQEEYTRMADYVATSSTQRHSLRLLDRNAALSKELRDFKSRHSICVERPEYDRVLSENDQLHSDRERLAAKVGQRDLNRIHDLKEIEFLRRDLERQVRERELQVREEAELHRRRSEEELERTWRRRSEEEARKAAEEVEQRWRLQHEETERQLSQRVNELNLTLMEERRSARSSLDEARRSLENERLIYEGHMARMEVDRISDYGRGFYRGGLEVQDKFYGGLEPYSDGLDPWLKFPGVPGPMGPAPSFLLSSPSP